VLLAAKISAIIFCKFLIETRFEKSVGIYSKQKVFRHLQKNFLSFLLEGLSPGLNSINTKTQKKFLNSVQIFKLKK
jgi:hypothetical protein